MIARERGVLVAAVDLESGMWKVAREMFLILQKELNVSKKEIDEINIDAIKDVLAKIGQMINMLDGVRGKNTKVRSISKEIDDDLIDLKDLVKEYQKELRSAITGDTNMNSYVSSKQYQPTISNGNGKEKSSQSLRIYWWSKLIESLKEEKINVTTTPSSSLFFQDSHLTLQNPFFIRVFAMRDYLL